VRRFIVPLLKKHCWSSSISLHHLSIVHYFRWRIFYVILRSIMWRFNLFILFYYTWNQLIKQFTQWTWNEYSNALYVSSAAMQLVKTSYLWRISRLNSCKRDGVADPIKHAFSHMICGTTLNSVILGQTIRV